MNFTRRNFLRVAGGCAATLAIPQFATRLLAEETAAPAQNSLVVVYLRGGADALNVLVPYTDKRYYDLRPSIAIPAEKGEEGAPVVKIDKLFGLHPSLEALKAWYEKGSFAPVLCAGSHHNTRSHFDAQDFMEYAAPGLRTVHTGWLNRFLLATNKQRKTTDEQLRAVAMQSLLPRALRGDFPVLAVPDDKVLNDKGLIDLFDKVYKDKDEKKEEKPNEMGERKEDSVKDTGKETVETLKRYKAILRKPVEGKRAKFPDGEFGKRMKDIAQIVRAGVGLEVASIDYNGWDDHVNEGGNEGQMATRLKNLGDGLSAFCEDLGDRLSSTLVLVMTEFGRTCKENGNEGTDHGHGGFMFLLGGGVKGGKIHGQWSGLSEKDLYQKRDLPVTTDFRDIFAEVLKQHMKFELPKDFFPEYAPKAVNGLF